MQSLITSRYAPHRTDRFPVLLIACAFGFWFFVVGSLVTVLPDRVASADQAERLTWISD